MNDTEQVEQPNDQPMFPSRDSAVASQVETCIRVANTMLPILFMTTREVEGGLPTSLDGGAQCAAANTFVTACDRLDKILNETDRWSIKPHDDVYSSLIATHEAIQANHAMQLVTQEKMQSPHWTYRPVIVKSGEGFVAYSGTTAIPNAIIVGKGLTPDEALADFDMAFTRGVAEQHRLNDRSVEILRQAEGTVEKAPEPPKKSFFSRLFRK